jgi:hypothetical protein
MRRNIALSSRGNAAEYATAMQDKDKEKEEDSNPKTCPIFRDAQNQTPADLSDEIPWDLPADELSDLETPAPAQPPAPSKPKRKPAKRAAIDEHFAAAWAAWPRRDRSSKSKALALWLAHPAEGPAKLAAVRAFTEGADAKKDGGAFVPAFERWTRDRLDSWLEASAPAEPGGAFGPPICATPDGEKVFRAMSAAFGAVAKAWLAQCVPVDGERLTFRAPSRLAFERLAVPTADHGGGPQSTRPLMTALAAAGVSILPPEKSRAR